MAVLVVADVTFRDSTFSRAVDKASWIPSKRPLLDKSNADIVFAGSSVIAEGLAPSVVSDRVARETGKTLRTFNFGCGGCGFAADFLVADSVLEIPAARRPKYFIVSLGPMEF